MKWQLRANSRLTTPRPSITPLERRKLLAAELRKLRSSATLDAAEKTKALAEADKAKASTWKERVETLRAAAIGFTVLYGITALFCYCFFIAKFMLSGVTAGDTLLFSFIALALGAIGIVLAAAGVMVWLPVTLPIEPKAKSKASVKGTKWAAGIYAAACVAYADDAAMEVSAANLQTLVAAADLQGDALDICRGPEGSAVVTGLKVWWHGIGTRSHVELPRADGPGVVVDLDTSQARLIRNHRARCMDLPGTYFDSGAESMTEDGRKQLLDAVQRWTQREMKDAQLEQIRVVGHTDPMTPAVGTTNRTLSNDRAQAVVHVLQDSGVLRGFFVRDTESLAATLRIEGDAARQPLKECPANSSVSERRECNAVNRRVELRFLFGPKSTTGRSAEAASSAAAPEQAPSAVK